MVGSDGDDTILNVRIPSSLASRIKEVSEKRGFKNKSEFVRTAIRDAVNPPEELSEQALQEIKESQEQAKEGNTTSLSDLTSGTEESTKSDQGESYVSNVSGQHSFGELSDLFSKEYSTGEPDLDVLAIGCGGAGNNIIDRLTEIGSGSIRTLALNTDRQHLNHIEADTKMLIGKSLTEGLGAAGEAELGEQAARNAEESIVEVISGADIVFVTGGLGGGTGTGVAPVVAELASEAGAISLGLVTTPFSIEGERQQIAREGMEKLRSTADTAIVFDNDLLNKHIPRLPIGKAFSLMDQIIAESMTSLVGTFSENALVDIDFADFSSVVQNGGFGGILLGEGEINDLDSTIQDTLQHPLINADLGTASSGLVQITGPNEMSLRDAEEIVETIVKHMSSDVRLVWGAQINEDLDSTVRVMVLLTGLEYRAESIVNRTTGIQSSDDVELLSSNVQGNPIKEGNPV